MSRWVGWMRSLLFLSLFFLVSFVPAPSPSTAPPGAKLLRYPHYHEGRITFTYFGDVWVADEDGSGARRLTVHAAGDVFPRFSPDGRWIAFSSDRAGNLDVYVIPAEGGVPRQLTFHSADDQVLGWTPDAGAVLFTSNRRDDWANKLYTVSVEGGMPVDVAADMGIYASFSPDGRKLAINRKAQAYWRQGYRGSNQSDVTVMEVAARRFAALTDFEGMDRWPMWSGDGHIYFVSDRGSRAVANIWRVPEGGGEAEAVTSFPEGEVRWPAMSADGRVIVFERDYVVWKLEVATRRAAAISVSLAAETQESLVEMRDFRSEVDDYDLAPGGDRIVFSIHGEVFAAPVEREKGDIVQLSAGPWRDRDPRYSPDGKFVAWISDASGREELYVAAADGSGEARKVSDVDALKLSFAWSPDSKQVSYVSSDNVLRRYELESGATSVLARSEWGGIGSPAWSPDGRWIAYAKAAHMRTTDIHLVAASGGEQRAVTFDSYSDVEPRFSPDGRKLYFIRSDALEAAISGPPSADLFSVTLEREAVDPKEAARDSAEAGGGEEGRRGGGSGAARREAPSPVAVDWPGLERRTRRLTTMAFPVTTFAVSPDGKTLAFVVRERRGERSVPVIYTVKEDGEGLTRVASGAPPGGDDDGGFGGGISDLRFAPSGQTLFYREGSHVYSVAVRPSGRGGEGGGEGGAARKRVEFTVFVKIDKSAEWAQMFDDGWRALRHRFYDPAMHGTDWDGARAKYRPLVAHAGTRDEVINLLNEMIGELNASHSGARGAPERRAPRVSTDHPGLWLEADAGAGRYRVTRIFEDGPADRDWVKVEVGDYLLAIDGREVKTGDNYWPLLNHHLNKKLELTLSKDPTGAGSWKTRIEPISLGAYAQLRYEAWVKERRALAEKHSGGRVGYLHIQAMNAPSLKKFEKELRENRTKEALIIDQRWNGGGNIEQQLLALLRQREYQILQPRGSRPTYRPAGGFFGPMVVLQNWRSGSNAEMFPAGFQALGLGKVIGTPTAGGVIGTGSYRLIDGSTVRMPASGVYLVDAERTNMENYGVPPDIHVENSPEDNLAGRDRVIEVAVEELLRALERRTAGSPR